MSQPATGIRSKKQFIYLVQGEAERLAGSLGVAASPTRDTIFLSYDKPTDNAIFYPNSGWAEGRNRLLQAAEEKGDYEYYIFCDDDIAFTRGNWLSFEQVLLRHRPAIGVPVVPKTRASYLKRKMIQPFLINDEQLMAFHNDVVRDRIVLPYISDFDNIHFWVATNIQQTLIQNFYPVLSLQFNDIEIDNTQTTRYPHDDKRLAAAEDVLIDFYQETFAGDYVKPSRQADVKELGKRMLRNRVAWIVACFSPVRSRSAKVNHVRKLLKPDSPLLQRFLETGKARS